MFEIPEAAPTWSSGTDDVDADEAGPFEIPSPTAVAISGRTNAAYAHEGFTNIRATKPTVASMKPSATALPAPIFDARGVMNGVITIMPAAAGSVATPAWSGLSPRAAGSWK